MSKRAPEPRPPACLNCGTALQGDHCYACGQPVKGAVRHFGSIVGDFLDTVFEYDGRLWRTLGPLLWRPGYLSNEYFAGRRVRYVSPFRLFFFLTVIAFLLAQLSVGGNEDFIHFGEGNRIELGEGLRTRGFAEARTEEEVLRLRDAALQGIEQGMGAAEIGPAAAGVRAGREAAQAAVRAEAERRIAELRAAVEAEVRADATEPSNDTDAAPGAIAEQAPDAGVPERQTDRRSPGDGRGLRFNDRDWHPVDNPVRVDGLPEAFNQRLNRAIGRAQQNFKRISEEPMVFAEAFVASIPATLFVLLPIFALLLKIVYVFKRRLYMEHLIIALHSHSFLSLSLLLLFTMGFLADWASGTGWITAPLRWMSTALIVWMPLYLLIMQKRVYRQGWILTLIKYAILGLAYVILLSLGGTVAFLVNMATL